MHRSVFRIRLWDSRVLVGVGAVVVSGLLTGRAEAVSEPPAPEGAGRVTSVAEGERVPKDADGPTIRLSYSKETFKSNPISSFMYFVPLISLSQVSRETSAENAQEVRVVSCAQKTTTKSFQTTLEFEIKGEGFHKNAFDPQGMIAKGIAESKKNKPLTNILDYIQFQGEGSGCIEVTGTIQNSKETVTQVDVQFNRNGQKSPVTIGLYDVLPKDGQYKYENRTNESIARVNSLKFKRSKTSPRMEVTVASITKTKKSEGFLANIKGAIANLFIKPVEITELGNETMLRFGLAIFQQQPKFMFPKAKNIKEEKSAATETHGP